MKWGVDGQRQSPIPVTPRKRPDSHGIISWVDPGAGLDGCLKSRLQWNLIPGPFIL